jgi:hypothetical protein
MGPRALARCMASIAIFTAGLVAMLALHAATSGKLAGGWEAQMLVVTVLIF